MAEYYPLLSKAVGSLPNSTPETRRVVYERARKALIGQLRTLHPPIPDEDIENESVQLDRAVERLEAELAAARPAPPAEKPGDGTTLTSDAATAAKPAEAPAEKPKPPLPLRGTLGPKAATPRVATRMPTPRSPVARSPAGPSAEGSEPLPALPADTAAASQPTEKLPAAVDPLVPPGKAAGDDAPPRADMQRPVAPQPATSKGPKRRMWIIPAGLAVAALVAVAAWQLRDKPETVSKPKPTAEQAESGKIAERVESGKAPAPSGSETSTPPGQTAGASDTGQAKPSAPAPNNPEVPVAHRAALLVEVKGEQGQQSQVKTFLGTVVWKLNNVSEGSGEAVGLAVEANIDVPEDKLKAVVTFEKNTDASLPASHTIKIRFLPEQGSYSGNVKQISVPQMRREDNPSGEALAGVTVPVVSNQFLVGLSPGNAESANLELIKSLQWIDVPMLLDSGRIAKLTFEKSDSGQRDLVEAIDKWQKP